MYEFVVGLGLQILIDRLGQARRYFDWPPADAIKGRIDLLVDNSSILQVIKGSTDRWSQVPLAPAGAEALLYVYLPPGVVQLKQEYLSPVWRPA
jgi:hypothetical protein